MLSNVTFCSRASKSISLTLVVLIPSLCFLIATVSIPRNFVLFGRDFSELLLLGMGSGACVLWVGTDFCFVTCLGGLGAGLVGNA